jgi:hypothetical protein
MLAKALGPGADKFGFDRDRVLLGLATKWPTNGSKAGEDDVVSDG